MRNGVLKVFTKSNLVNLIREEELKPITNQMLNIISDYRKTNFTFTDLLQECKGNDVRHFLLLNDKQDDLIGVCKTETIIKNQTAYLSSFVINPYYRGGYGSIFMSSVSNILYLMNYKKIELKVHEDNISAQKCYEKNDFDYISKENKRFIMNKRF